MLTTGNPYYDWCGFVGSKLQGVVDILAQSGHSIVIGEIKGLRFSCSEGIWQLVGAMHTAFEKTGKWIRFQSFLRSFFHNSV